MGPPQARDDRRNEEGGAPEIQASDTKQRTCGQCAHFAMGPCSTCMVGGNNLRVQVRIGSGTNNQTNNMTHMSLGSPRLTQRRKIRQ